MPLRTDPGQPQLQLYKLGNYDKTLAEFFKHPVCRQCSLYEHPEWHQYLAPPTHQYVVSDGNLCTLQMLPGPLTVD